jgi:hypothetical protein
MRVNVKTLDKFEGAYRIAVASGLVTGLSAGDPIFSLRWAPALPTSNPRQLSTFVLERMRVKWRAITDFTAAQEAGVDIFVARAFTASDSGGTAATLTTNNAKKRTSFPTTLVTDMRISTTGALTAGTRTLDAQPIASGVYSDLANAATVQKGGVDVEVLDQDQDRFPLVLGPTTATGARAQEGIVVTNRVAMGAGGTARVIVELDWLELQRY